MTKKEFEYHYGKTKLDHALSYLCEAIKGACVLSVSIALTYWVIYWISQVLADWIYKTF